MRYILIMLLLAVPCLLADEWTNSIKVVSDKVEDCATMEDVLSWMVKPGMSDRDKGLAVWETSVKFRHQTGPPNEFRIDNAHDIIKTMNVYGYGQCCCVSSHIESLARRIGLEARGRIVTHHSVPEVKWGGKWHYLDASLVTYFTKPDGHIYSVDELIEVYKAHMAANPNFKPKRSTPPAEFPSPFKDCFNARPGDGMLPAMIHTVESAWSCFDGKNNGEYEYIYSEGYRALFKIRRGEKLIRNWSNKGLHVNMHDGGSPGPVLEGTMDDSQLKYQRGYGDLGNNRVGNGLHIYSIPFSQAGWMEGMQSLTNCAKAVGLTPADKTQPAEAVIRMHIPYVYLKGSVALSGDAAAGSSLKVQVSTNNGRAWKDAGTIEKTGAFKEEIDISKLVFRRYDYLVRLSLSGNIAVKEAVFSNDIQHSQRALPALAGGTNTIKVSSGPAIDTLTIEPTLNPDNKAKFEHLGDYEHTLENAKYSNGVWATAYGPPGFLTFPVTVPGDIHAVRFGGAFRARGNKDGHELQLSFDKGKTWITADKAMGPYAGYCKYTDYTQVPRGAREVLVRYKLLQGSNTTGIFGLRIDVDYWDTPDGKPSKDKAQAPLKITYEWSEGGPKKNVKVVNKAEESYTIKCSGKPKMTSITVELAD